MLNTLHFRFLFFAIVLLYSISGNETGNGCREEPTKTVCTNIKSTNSLKQELQGKVKTNITLTDCELDDLGPNLFPPTTKCIKVNGGKIATLKTETFASLPNLKRLEFNYVTVDTTERNPFKGASSLDTLISTNLDIKTVEPSVAENVLVGLENLKTIGISGRHEAIPLEAFLVLKSIENFYGDNSGFDGFQKEAMTTFTDLKTLILVNNNMSDIPSDALAKLHKLEELYMYKDGIKNIDKDAFKGLGQLKFLVLSENDISRLPEGVFAPLGSLSDLKLYNNSISHIQQEVFDGLDKLEFLDLSLNSIENIPPSSFESLKSLQRLSLANNKIQNLHNTSLNGLDNLLVLFLGGNKLSSVFPGLFNQHLRKLLALDLCSNGLESIAPGTFNELGSLEYLNLANNRLTNLAPGALQGKHIWDIT